MKQIKLEENDLVFAKVRPNAIIPTKDDENAGYDIYANFEEDYLVIPPHSTKLVPTGIASAMTDKYYLNVAERGSTGKIGMKYSAGIIDSGYRGEIFIALTNTNSVDIIISKLTREELVEKYGHMDDFYDNSVVLKEDRKVILVDRRNSAYNLDSIIYPYTKAIAQLIIHEVPKMNIKEITYEELCNIPSKRGDGALGSTGK